ncbi:translation initiation factor IF-2 N-terminal domain-containing protein [Herbaspirillum chlorophenolicum]|uniref:translation initiation factor IF-2 N-terminal domain-containing protein n=1 Tax=Herbaspirillum chlorophenolicum TaxID=211589 RepID=UPI0009E45AD1|nr:translation initiation factor IF-2 N-terminal domain-containing protein [Herbaspirillum chlorophenolicum]
MSTTVAQFALELKMPADLLLSQLSSAGVEKKSASEQITREDKDQLLEHLRRTRGASQNGEKKKITLVRKENTSPNTSPKPRHVEIDRQKNKFYVEQDGSKTALELTLNEPSVTDVSIENLGLLPDPKSTKNIRWQKLQSVEIKNFKAIDSLKLSLADVTVMVGPNGSGKSSVLQAIHWVARAASYIPPKNQNEVIAFDRLDYSPSSEPLKTAHKKELSSDRGTPPTSVVFNHGPAEDGATAAANIKIWAARNRSGISVHIEGGTAVTPFKQREEVITAYIPGLAGLSEAETILVQPLLRRRAASGDAGGVLRNVLFNIASRQAGEQDNELARQRVSKLNELIQIIHPDVQLEVSFNDREDINIQALFDDRLLAGTKRPLEAAATGVLQVVQIFAYLILFRPKLLLIDEPDAHLHPDKQERLIEALEQAAAEFHVQVILTTHSPHIVRAASPSTNLVWVNEGKVVEQEEDSIRALLGWGGLDKKILFFVEDEDDLAIRSILRQWPQLYRQLTICRCFGIDNLPKNALLKGLLNENSFGIKALIHRDRDFMTEDEGELWSKRYSAKDTFTWITDHVDVEAYFCQPEYLAAVFNISKDTADSWIAAAIKNCSKTKELFLEKRKIINRLLHENGGSPLSETLWKECGEISAGTILGKTLHKALKTIVKENKYDEKQLDRFFIPRDFAMAPSLKSILEKILN